MNIISYEIIEEEIEPEPTSTPSQTSTLNPSTRYIIADLVDSILIDSDKTIKIEFKFQDEVKKYDQFFDSSFTDDTLVI